VAFSEPAACPQEDAASAPGAFAAPAEAAMPCCGAFVSIHKNGELRGCIGHVAPDASLEETIARCAVAAGTADPRFAPLTASELPGVHIEISVLGPLMLVAAADEIEVGRDGLMVERDGRRGLLLPQVAIEWGWNRETFLAQTCRKAGLPGDAWRHGARLWRFEADVFGEPIAVP
jgi:AmmeMemoRadiSam system protein A